jgi:hypothetical protein
MALRAILLDEHTMLFREGLVSILSSYEGGIERCSGTPQRANRPSPFCGRTAPTW